MEIKKLKKHPLKTCGGYFQYLEKWENTEGGLTYVAFQTYLKSTQLYFMFLTSEAFCVNVQSVKSSSQKSPLMKAKNKM